MPCRPHDWREPLPFDHVLTCEACGRVLVLDDCEAWRLNAIARAGLAELPDRVARGGADGAAWRDGTGGFARGSAVAQRGFRNQHTCGPWLTTSAP